MSHGDAQGTARDVPGHLPNMGRRCGILPSEHGSDPVCWRASALIAPNRRVTPTTPMPRRPGPSGLGGESHQSADPATTHALGGMWPTSNVAEGLIVCDGCEIHRLKQTNEGASENGRAIHRFNQSGRSPAKRRSLRNSSVMVIKGLPKRPRVSDHVCTSLRLVREHADHGSRHSNGDTFAAAR